MKIEALEIQDVKIILPDVFLDARGCFFESYHKEIFARAGIASEFVQDNQSVSARGVLRGLHYQNPPFAQGKLVRVVKGAVLDVAVDIRKKSPTYGKWVSRVLSQSNNLIMWIPPGFAHGFLVLEEDSIFLYKCTSNYHKEAEATLIWNDPDLAIEWGNSQPVLSDKDLMGVKFRSMNSLF